MNNLVHYIGGRTHFSLGQSIFNPKKLVNELAGVAESATVTDFNSVNALPFIYKEGKHEDLKLNFGAVVRVVDDIAWRKPKKDEKKSFDSFFSPRLIAKNDEGVKDIMRLLSLANDVDHYYFLPRLTIQDLIDTANLGNIYVTTGDTDSLFAHDSFKTLLSTLVKSLRANILLFELVPVNTAYYDKLNQITLQVAQKLNWPIVITRPIYYSQGGAATRNAMYCATNRATVDSRWRSEPAVENFYPMIQQDIQQEMRDLRVRMTKRGLESKFVGYFINEAIDLTNKIGKQLDYTWKPYDICLPNMSSNPLKSLVDITKAGWTRRLEKKVYGYQPDKADLPVYRERLKYELTTLKNMGFENYFLLVHQVTDKAREMGIMVGPGRGSVGGSLVAFLMGITDVDPIRFNLIFERFINPDRLDLPDADLDFMSSRREDIINWLVEEYGQEYVCGISNYGALGSSSALRYAGKIHDLNPFDYACSKQVPKEHGSSKSLQEAIEEVPAIQTFANQHPAVWKDAVNLQGIFNIYGQHAAGVVVAGRPIIEHGVVETRKGGQMCNWDKSVVEDFGLVKLDVLGLSNLDVLSLCKEYIYERHGIEIDYEDVPLDDPKILKAFGQGRTNAIFQFESGGFKSLLKSLAQEQELTFEDLSAATALFRPGPIDAGLLEQYVSVKQGDRLEQYPHPLTEPALKETAGVMVYQEQVMQIARDLSGFSMTEADILRKAIGKKDANLMATMGEKFIKGAMDSGMSQNQAEDLWDDILGFAAYSFNKSHSVAYTMISYLTMWLKIKYPSEFFAASMSILKEEKLPGLVRDCDAAGVLIVPPDINLSTHRFEIGFDKQRDKQTLVIPFQRLKGLSTKAVDAIIEAREKRLEEKGSTQFTSKQEFLDMVAKRTCNIRVQTALDEVGAFASVEPDQIPALHPDRVKDQKIKLPGLISQEVKADRKIDVSPFVRIELEKLYLESATCCESYKRNPVVRPYLAEKIAPKFMVVTDAPNYGEEQAGNMMTGKACKDVEAAYKAAGLKKSEGYFTSVSKMMKPKGDKKLPPQMIMDFGPILLKEIDLLKPPVIVALGNEAARFLLPDLKGGWEEIAGTTHYDVKLDCTIVIGCNPAMVYFDPERLNIIVDAFDKAREIFE